MLQLDLEREMGVYPEQRTWKGAPGRGESLCIGPEVGKQGTCITADVLVTALWGSQEAAGGGRQRPGWEGF